MQGNDAVGISGFAVYLPPYRVDLKEWCDWTGNDRDKIANVVGSGFRMTAPDQDVYVLAANAVLRLIQSHAIDPARVNFLGFGTETSTDNSAGAVIVRGLVDQALDAFDMPRLSRQCEVPEFKHACLGGVYALKNALRYLAVDADEGSVAVVVSADIARYARGSGGEPTQGAGAVAMLLERRPKLLEVDLRRSGKSSGYRVVDFRKPLVRFSGQQPGEFGLVKELPVFNGKYSTTCYLEAVTEALRDCFARDPRRPLEQLESLAAVFMHRPYRQLPEKALMLATAFALAATDDVEFAGLCASVGTSVGEVRGEAAQGSAYMRLLVDAQAWNGDIYPASLRVVRAMQRHPRYQQQVADRSRLGGAAMMEMGNLYSATLPAWLGAGMAEAARDGIDLQGREMLMVGYGSGDAAEALGMRVAEGWRDAALRLDVVSAMEGWVRLDQAAYEALHDHGVVPVAVRRGNEFVIHRLGQADGAGFQDAGIAYHAFVAPSAGGG